MFFSKSQNPDLILIKGEMIADLQLIHRSMQTIKVIQFVLMLLLISVAISDVSL